MRQQMATLNCGGTYGVTYRSAEQASRSVEGAGEGSRNKTSNAIQRAQWGSMPLHGKHTQECRARSERIRRCTMCHVKKTLRKGCAPHNDLICGKRVYRCALHPAHPWGRGRRQVYAGSCALRAVSV